MDTWVYVLGVILLLFIISQKAISNSRNKVDADRDTASRDKLEGKTSALTRAFEKMG